MQKNSRTTLKRSRRKKLHIINAGVLNRTTRTPMIREGEKYRISLRNEYMARNGIINLAVKNDIKVIEVSQKHSANRCNNSKYVTLETNGDIMSIFVGRSINTKKFVLFLNRKLSIKGLVRWLAISLKTIMGCNQGPSNKGDGTGERGGKIKIIVNESKEIV